MGVWLITGMRLGFAALLALGLLAGSAGAVVKIHDKTLSAIDDIMAELNLGTRAYEKNSLMVFRYAGGHSAIGVVVNTIYEKWIKAA